MISVIIPTYKAKEALDLCIHSAVSHQHYEHNEIIVVVDGTYNYNKEILKKWSNRIRILDIPSNQGLCVATNLGVAHAKFERVLIVNDDNVFPPNWDSLLLEHSLTNTVVSPNQIEPTASMFKQFVIKDYGRTPQEFNMEKYVKHCTTKIDRFFTEAGSTLPIYITKRNYNKVGGWDPMYPLGLVADWDFFLKCGLVGMNFVRAHNILFYHFGSLTVNSQERMEKERSAHEYSRTKWGSYIQHNPETNEKTLKINDENVA